MIEMKKKSHRWNILFLILGIIVMFIGAWQTLLISIVAGSPTVTSWLSAILTIFGFFILMDTLYNWAVRPHWQIIAGVQAGLLMAFIFSIVFDIPASGAIQKNALDWIFYIPIGIRNGLPYWGWDATAIPWGNAYVIMFALWWLGPLISSLSMWFWEPD